MEMPRWTVAELLTRYELEPTLTDVFVEGQFDKDILSCAYDHAPHEKRAMYTADVLDIPKNLFEKHKLTKGNKQKLIILCRELSQANAHENVRFIVDRDNDHWFGTLESGKGLLWTAFCDIEAYFFEEEFVKELVINAGKAKIDNWGVFYDSFYKTLVELFSVRVAARDAKLCLSYMSVEKFLYVKQGKVFFDLSTYVQRTLHKSQIFDQTEELVNASGKWRERFNGDPRLFCRGHDFVMLIAWSIMKFKGSQSLSDDVIARILILLVPRDADRFASLL